MGLDIYWKKVKKSRTNNIDRTNLDEVYSVTNEQYKEGMTKVLNASIKRLKKLSGHAEAYDKAYVNAMKRLSKWFDYPEFALDKLGVSRDYSNGTYNYEVHPVSVIEESVEDNIMKRYYAPGIAYFRKANFVYQYFSEKLVNEWTWVSREDIERLIEKCDKVLNDHSVAPDELPTTSGFFFGPTDYDEWYFRQVRDCRKQMKDILKHLADDDEVYVVMSW